MCYDGNAQPPIPPGTAGATRAEDLVLMSADSAHFAAFAAYPEVPGDAHILIYPDVRGLHQFYKDLAVRFAETGIAALAMDYFGRTAGLTSRDETFEYMPHVQKVKMTTILQDARASLAHLRQGPGASQSTFATGFCIGGTITLYSGAEDLDLKGVIAFYSGLTRVLDENKGTALQAAKGIRVPVLGLFGGADAGIPPEQVDAFERGLTDAGVEHEIVTYPGAPHSFFDRRYEEHAEACADAWRRVLGFL